MWPKWFPYPKAWLKAVWVSFLLSVLAVSLRFFGFWGLLLYATFKNLAPAIIAVTLGLLVPGALTAVLHRLFFGQGRWKPSVLAGANASMVMLGASIITTIALLPFIECHLDITAYCDRFSEAQITFFSLLWFVSAAYLYHCTKLIQLRQKPKPSTKPAAKPAVRRDPIEIELEKLRGEMGITKIRKLPPDSPK